MNRPDRRRFRSLLSASIELLEERTNFSWLGVPPVALNPIPASVAVTLNASRAASGSGVFLSGENDFIRFTAPVSGSYRIETQSAGLDTVLGVFGSGGSRLGYNDDISGFDLDSRVSVNLTAGQLVYVGMTTYTGTANGAYTFTIQGPTVTTPPPTSTDDRYDAGTGNDTLATATGLGTLNTANTFTQLVMADSADWYKFTMPGAGSTSDYVQLAFQHAAGDLDLKLYNAAGTLLVTSDGTSNTERISLSGMAAGTYYAQAYGYNGARNATYTLTIDPGVGTVTPPPPTNSAFDIRFVFSGLNTTQQAVFERAAQRWESVIVGALSSATYNGITTTGLIINASVTAIDGVGNVLGQAGPDRFRANGLPYHGEMEFDSADMTAMQNNGSLFSVILHEMGHVLGIGTIWDNKGLIAGAGTSSSRFIGANAVREYNAIFGLQSVSVPVETTGGPGTADGHWRESTFGSELMTGFVGPGVNLPLSRMTVGSLQDLGYTVNYAAADAYSRPAAVRAASSSTLVSGSMPAVRLSDRNGRTSIEYLNHSSGSAQTTRINANVPTLRSLDQAFAELCDD